MTRAPTPLPLRAYLAATAIAGPLARRLLDRRRASGKEDAARLRERLGHPGRPRPDGPLVWLHAASVGESLALLPLLGRLLAERPEIGALITSGTVTSASLLAERLPARAVHQYVPVDTAAAVTRFLDHWQPDLAVWTESELWPRLICQAHARGTPMLLVNARMSQRSLKRWRRAPRTAAALLARFDGILAQDTATAEGLRALGLPDASLAVSGSIKQAAAALPCDEAELERLRAAIGNRFTWLAASTHPGEEALAAEAHLAFRQTIPDALLIVAPRHPERSDEVAMRLTEVGLSPSRRREGPPPLDAAVYLADTLGEMGLWYRLAPVSLVGGSFGAVGGHNPYEPIALNSAVLHGPDTTNFADIYRTLTSGGGSRLVRSADDLAAALTRLADPDARDALVRRAAEIAAGDGGALEAAAQAILDRLPPTPHGRGRFS